ncbi:MAG: Mur ligase family protein [Erysipelotrichales bacterium]
MKYYFIGIKGSGMASLAHILLDLGNEVSGSDIEQHIFTEDSLRSKGVNIYPFNKDNIKEDMVIVKGNSFDENHEEVKRAIELGLSIYPYVEMLQKIIVEHYSVCIAGTHGKTTTTGIVKTVFEKKENTGFLIGDGHGYMMDDAKNFIVESCEYKDNYLNYYPNIVLINNIELDHVDYFKSMEQYLDSFYNFSQHAKDSVIINGDDKNCMKLKQEDNFFYFGLEDHNNYQAKNIEFSDEGFSFDFYTDFNRTNKEKVYHFEVAMFGQHMLYNCLAAIGIYLLKGIDEDYAYIEQQLNDFKGVSRRFEVIEEGSNVFVDDYAHHPTAINLMIETVKQKYPDKKVIAFFKPDRYSRIYEFGEEIGHVLNNADEVYLFEFPITSAKEPGIDIDMNYVLQHVKNGKIIEETQEWADYFKDYKDSIFLMMSSKNVYDFREMLISSTK